MMILGLSLFGCTKSPEPNPDPDPIPTLSVSPSSISLSGNKGGSDSIQITHAGNWTVSIEPSSVTWMKLSATSGTGNAKLYVTAEENNTTTAARSAVVTVKSANAQVGPQSVQVSQKVAEDLPFHKLIGGSSLDAFEDVVVLPDGYLGVGSTTSSGGDIAVNKGKSDLLVAKFDRSGSMVWLKTFGGTENDYGYAALAVSDGILVAGTTWSANGDVVGNKGFSDAWLLKLNSSGDLQWQKTFGGSGPDDAVAISTITGGGYYLTGKTESADGDITNLPPGTINVTNAFVIKTDNTGNKVWAKAVGTQGSEYGRAVTQTADGGCVVFGILASSSSYPSEPVMSKGGWDYYVFRLSGSGDLQWQKGFGGVDNEFARAITSTSDGGFVLAGYTVTINNGDVTGSLGDTDGWLVKISADGNALWKKTVGSIAADDPYDIIEVGTDLYVAGTSAGQGSPNGYDGWVAKVSSTGTGLLQKTFGGSDKDQVNAIKFISSGYFVCGGFSLSNNQQVSGQKGAGDAWLFTYKE